jgi:hypothetical protein
MLKEGALEAFGPSASVLSRLRPVAARFNGAGPAQAEDAVEASA